MKKIGLGQWIIIVLLLAVVILFLTIGPAAALGFYALTTPGAFNKPEASGIEGEDAGVRANSCTTPFYPKVIDELGLAKAIDDYIPDSAPLNGLGKDFVAGSKKSGTNPAHIVAIAEAESTFGQYGIATNGGHNAFGRKATSSQPSVGGYYAWPTWAMSLNSNNPKYEDISAYIKRRYIDEGLKTIEKISAVYCPPQSSGDADYCKNTEYVKNIYSFMNKIYEKAGSAVECK